MHHIQRFGALYRRNQACCGWRLKRFSSFPFLKIMRIFGGPTPLYRTYEQENGGSVPMRRRKGLLTLSSTALVIVMRSREEYKSMSMYGLSGRPVPTFGVGVLHPYSKFCRQFTKCHFFGGEAKENCCWGAQPLFVYKQTSFELNLPTNLTFLEFYQFYNVDEHYWY